MMPIAWALSKARLKNKGKRLKVDWKVCKICKLKQFLLIKSGFLTLDKTRNEASEMSHINYKYPLFLSDKWILGFFSLV